MSRGLRISTRPRPTAPTTTLRQQKAVPCSERYDTSLPHIVETQGRSIQLPNLRPRRRTRGVPARRVSTSRNGRSTTFSQLPPLVSRLMFYVLILCSHHIFSRSPPTSKVLPRSEQYSVERLFLGSVVKPTWLHNHNHNYPPARHDKVRR